MKSFTKTKLIPFTKTLTLLEKKKEVLKIQKLPKLEVFEELPAEFRDFEREINYLRRYQKDALKEQQSIYDLFEHFIKKGLYCCKWSTMHEEGKW